MNVNTKIGKSLSKMKSLISILTVLLSAVLFVKSQIQSDPFSTSSSLFDRPAEIITSSNDDWDDRRRRDYFDELDRKRNYGNRFGTSYRTNYGSGWSWGWGGLLGSWSGINRQNYRNRNYRNYRRNYGIYRRNYQKYRSSAFSKTRYCLWGMCWSF